MRHKKLKSIEIKEKELSIAIKKGLNTLGLRREQVEIKIKQDSKKGGLFGLGAKKAIVVVTEKRWATDFEDAKSNNYNPIRKKKSYSNTANIERRTEANAYEKHLNSKWRAEYLEKVKKEPIPAEIEEVSKKAQDLLLEIIAGLDYKIKITNTYWDSLQRRIYIIFQSENKATLIGKKGDTILAMQYYITLVFCKALKESISICLDTEDYNRKQEDKIFAELEYAITQIKDGKKTYRLKNNTSQNRKFIHKLVEGMSDIETYSQGAGNYRRVILKRKES